MGLKDGRWWVVGGGSSGGRGGGVRAKEGGGELLVYGFYGLAEGGTRYKMKPEFPDLFFLFSQQSLL